MRIYSHDDPELEPFREAASNHTRQFEMMGMPYWVFVEGSEPIGVVSYGEEPLQLLAPPGTRFSLIRMVDLEKPVDVLGEFASRALALSKKKNIEYAVTSFPAGCEELAGRFMELGFEELANTYRMVCRLDGAYEPSGGLRFERVERGETTRFIEITREYMSGSRDVVMNLMLEHLLEVPEEFLDLWYGMETFYYVHDDGEIVAILDINTEEGMISNIGVAPQHRGKGIGRQVMLFGLRALKGEGCERARLRVHVDNAPAIHLYETLGFSVEEQFLHLIWRR